EFGATRFCNDYWITRDSEMRDPRAVQEQRPAHERLIRLRADAQSQVTQDVQSLTGLEIIRQNRHNFSFPVVIGHRRSPGSPLILLVELEHVRVRIIAYSKQTAVCPHGIKRRIQR